MHNIPKEESKRNQLIKSRNKSYKILKRESHQIGKDESKHKNVFGEGTAYAKHSKQINNQWSKQTFPDKKQVMQYNKNRPTKTNIQGRKYSNKPF